jgi:DNA-binding response OmpR family regulator
MLFLAGHLHEGRFDMNHGTIVIIEDDRRTADLIALYLEREGFKAIKAFDGQKGLAQVTAHKPLLVILDLMLPKLDGWEVCRTLRRDSDIPVIMLTARGDETDRVAGLTLGADDYVVKPFSPSELVARVKAVLRRVAPSTKRPVQVLGIGSIKLDPRKHQATKAGATLQLTPHEYTLLKKLMAAPGRVFSRTELINALYPDGEAFVIDRVIDVHVGKLRQKIEADPTRPQYILTIRGVGYTLNETPDEQEDS